MSKVGAMGGKAKRDGWDFSLMALPVRAGGWGVAFSFPLIAAGRPSTFWLDPKSTKKIKGFPKVPWARGSARLLSARAEGYFYLVPHEGECWGLQPKALSAHRPASDSKPYWHCRKARRNYEGYYRAVTPVSVVGNVYERSGMSASARPSLAPVNERRNHLPVVIAHITGDLSQTNPLITKPGYLIADRQHTRIAQTFNQQNRSNASLAVQFINRSPVSLAKNPPWLVRCEEFGLGTHDPAPGAAAAFLCLLSFRCRKESETRGSENVNHSSLLHSAVNRCTDPVINPSTIHSKIY